MPHGENNYFDQEERKGGIDGKAAGSSGEIGTAISPAYQPLQETPTRRPSVVI
jgi:hypothetical protein